MPKLSFMSLHRLENLPFFSSTSRRLASILLPVSWPSFMLLFRNAFASTQSRETPSYSAACMCMCIIEADTMCTCGLLSQGTEISHEGLPVSSHSNISPPLERERGKNNKNENENDDHNTNDFNNKKQWVLLRGRAHCCHALERQAIFSFVFQKAGTWKALTLTESMHTWCIPPFTGKEADAWGNHGSQVTCLRVGVELATAHFQMMTVRAFSPLHISCHRTAREEGDILLWQTAAQP